MAFWVLPLATLLKISSLVITPLLAHLNIVFCLQLIVSFFTTSPKWTIRDTLSTLCLELRGPSSDSLCKICDLVNPISYTPTTLASKETFLGHNYLCTSYCSTLLHASSLYDCTTLLSKANSFCLSSIRGFLTRLNRHILEVQKGKVPLWLSIVWRAAIHRGL